MKKFALLTVILIVIVSCANSQEPKPEILKEPVNWQFERFMLPPSFAPGLNYKGVEELRFSPGMFKKDSADYFTYAFISRFDSMTDISMQQVRDYYLGYFRGLCAATARDRKLVIDTTAISVDIEKKKDAGIIYAAKIQLFGVFADGARVKLNSEIKVVKDVMRSKVYLMAVSSPQPKTATIWQTLYYLLRNYPVITGQ